MDEIVLDINLKYVLAPLDLSERGELLTALFDGSYTGSNTAVKNVYHYISLLQQDFHRKRQHMRELSAKGVAARAQKKDLTATTALSPTSPQVKRRSFKKEIKEDLNNKYNLNLFSPDSSHKNLLPIPPSPQTFVPPHITQVQQFITDNELQVDAETFINFYESHGWMVGSTPIKSWQATLKLWHLRATSKFTNNSQQPYADETYWHQLAARVTQNNFASTDTSDTTDHLTNSARQNLPSELHHSDINDDNSSLPFARFMHRVEKYDLNDNNKEKTNE